MGDPRQIAYGDAGGRGPQGALLTRFQIAGDPSKYFPIWAAAGLNTNTPPWLLDRGAPTSYGPNVISPVGGPFNLYNDGNVLRSCIGLPVDLVAQDIIWNLSGYNVITETANKYRAIVPDIQVLDVNGEHCFRDVTGAASRLSPVAEQFSFAASTITATNGSANITVSLANGLTSAATLPGYAYTPGKNAPTPGDVVEIVDGGVSRFFRLVSVTGGTTGTIFPNYNSTGGAGLTYRLWRTGYGSWSRGVTLLDNSNGDLYHYYAGLTGNADTNWGTVQCIKRTLAGVLTHFMSPLTVDAVGTPTVFTANAVDVCYYKGFLLYGAGPGISWSAAPFPSSFTTAFGTADLPAANISAFNRQGTFLYFEQSGEQVIAIFDDSVWLVQATGSVPEFNFYRLPEPIGAAKAKAIDPQIGTFFSYTRAACSGRNAIFYGTLNGTMVLSGLTTKRITAPIEAAVQGGWAYPGFGSNYSYDKYSDAVIITSAPVGQGVGAQSYGLAYQPDQDSFFRLTPVPQGSSDTTLMTMLTGGVVATGVPYRRFALGSFASNRMKANPVGPESEFTATVTGAGWYWPSLIVSVGDIYNGFIYGGLRVMARAQSGLAAPVNMTVQVYGGASPNAMKLRETITFDYSIGTTSARALIGARWDDAFLAFVLSGDSWIELSGIAIYDAATESAR